MSRNIFNIKNKNNLSDIATIIPGKSAVESDFAIQK